MVAEGQIEDPAPKLETEEAALYWQAFWRLCSRSIALGGMGGVIANVSLDWASVVAWADRRGLAEEDAVEILFAMRDERDSLENKFLSEKK